MAVELKGVTKIYKIGSVEVLALDGVTQHISRGEVVVLMGPSGSGKTTLLNIIATLDKPTYGEVYVLGVDVGKMSEKNLEKFRLRNVGYLFQSYNLVTYLTAEQNVALPLIALGVKKDWALLRAKILLELVGLEKVGEMYPHQMSGGMQQRVAVARALATSPPLLILDEPTSNVDLENAATLLSLIAAINKVIKTTAIIATHDPDVAAIATRVIYMRDGRAYEATEPPRRELKIDLERVATAYEKLRQLDSLIGL
ncbi:MAG: ABC transporter ATP-binding protein [Pyrobaculum sp.]